MSWCIPAPDPILVAMFIGFILGMVVTGAMVYAFSNPELEE